MSKVFISYSHQDEAWKNRLQTHLAALQKAGLLTFWDDRQIPFGDDWNPAIKNAMQQAQVAIMLVSADYLASDFIQREEIVTLLQRRKAEGIKVIPLIIKPCPWTQIGWLNQIQGRDGLPDDQHFTGLSS